jgi:hypothetical protein
LRILIVLNNPACKIVRGIQERQKNLFKLPAFFSHHTNGPTGAGFIPRRELFFEEFRNSRSAGDAELGTAAPSQELRAAAW